jgi:hypothetical protein
LSVDQARSPFCVSAVNTKPAISVASIGDLGGWGISTWVTRQMPFDQLCLR